MRQRGKSDMSEEPKRRSFSWLWWVIAVPVLYVLSIGPAARIYQELELAGYDVGWFGAGCQISYWPIIWFIDQNNTFSEWLQKYGELWGL